MKKLVWNDPDPIPGNDYEVTYLKHIVDDGRDSIYLIHYGGGSEAEVYGHELEVVDVEPKETKH